MIELTRKQFNGLTKAYQIIMITAMLSIILIIGIVQNKISETILCLASFLALKEMYFYKIHNESMLSCFLYSVLVFACLSRLSLPIEVSLLCGPVLGLLTAYAAAKLSRHFEQDRVTTDFVLRFKEQEIQSSPKEDFIRECQKAKLSEEMTEFAVKALFLKRNRQSLADEYKMSLSTIKSKITKLNKLFKGMN